MMSRFTYTINILKNLEKTLFHGFFGYPPRGQIVSLFLNILSISETTFICFLNIKTLLIPCIIFLCSFILELALTYIQSQPSISPTKFSIKDLVGDGFLLAVPKFRRTIEKRWKRKYGSPQYVWKMLVPKNNIKVCNECGHHHEQGRLCGMVFFLYLFCSLVSYGHNTTYTISLAWHT